ncbi:MAG: hypothetical protein ACRC11_22220, partial [Xenococcaceae cyanobacterium]
MSIDPITLNIQNFSWLWTLVTLIGSILSLPTSVLFIFINSPINPVILAYWLSISIVQATVLQSFAPWAYQWGLVTFLCGIICFQSSIYIWFFFFKLEAQKEQKVLEHYVISNAYAIENLFNIDTSSDYSEEVIIIQLQLFVIVPSIIFFSCGFLFGSCQLVLFWLDRIKIGILLQRITGLTWLLRYMIYLTI